MLALRERTIPFKEGALVTGIILHQGLGSYSVGQQYVDGRTHNWKDYEGTLEMRNVSAEGCYG